MKIYIKNMVCNRCKMAVENLFATMNYSVQNVELGVVDINEKLSQKELINIDKQLQTLGFELLEDAVKKQIETVKLLIIQKVEELTIEEDFVLSQFLAKNIHKDYSAISKSFSQNEGITIEQYFILQKIEKVKELIFYNEFSLTQIAGMLGYKSVQHLSAQFKNVTGFTPSSFKKLRSNQRISLDDIA